MYKQEFSSIETPAILKSFRRTSDSPRSKLHLPPSNSSYLNQNFQQVSNTISDHQIQVFGFENKYKAQILQKFQKLGEIEDIKDNGGNWVNIKYRDINSAYKAAELNGCIPCEGVMIGVKLIAPMEKKSNEHIQYTEELPDYLKRKNKKKNAIWSNFLTYVLNFDS